MIESRALLAATFCLGSACAVLWLSRARQLRDPLLLTLLPALAYAGLMVMSASRVEFDAIQHARFWTPIWPLITVALVCTAAHAVGFWRRLVATLVIAALLLCGWTQVTWLVGALPSAQQPRGLLTPAWRPAAEALPEPAQCRLFVTDVRPLMLQRRLGPVSEIPQSFAAFESAAHKHDRLCLAVFSRKLRVSSSAERRRVDQEDVVAALQRSGRLEPLSAAGRVTVYRVRPGGSP